MDLKKSWTMADDIEMIKKNDNSKTYGANILKKRYCKELAEWYAQRDKHFNKEKFLNDCGV